MQGEIDLANEQCYVLLFALVQKKEEKANFFDSSQYNWKTK